MPSRGIHNTSGSWVCSSGCLVQVCRAQPPLSRALCWGQHGHFEAVIQGDGVFVFWAVFAISSVVSNLDLSEIWICLKFGFICTDPSHVLGVFLGMSPSFS